MLYNVYSIKDELANTFGNLIVMHPATAQRSWKWMTNEMEESECDDKRIYQVGTFNTDTGIINAMQPTMVYNIEEAKKNASKNLSTV